jgi:hypothetical protein
MCAAVRDPAIALCVRGRVFTCAEVGCDAVVCDRIGWTRVALVGEGRCDANEAMCSAIKRLGEKQILARVAVDDASCEFDPDGS